MVFQEKFHKIMDSGLVDEVLDRGRDYATAIAAEKYDTIRRVVGFGRK